MITGIYNDCMTHKKKEIHKNVLSIGQEFNGT
jgi:hypothetical protein